MTDITDQDRRVAHEWARIAVVSKGNQEHEPWVTAARYILATVDAPAPALSEELRSWAEDASYDEDRDNLRHAAARAEQIEQERDEARAEVDQARSELAEVMHARDSLREDYDHARAEVERLDAVAEDYARRATAALTERDEARAEAKTWREQDENDCEAYMEELKSVREALAVEGRRVEKITKERDEARDEVERLTAKAEDRKWEVQKYRDRCANQRKELDRLNRTDRELRAEVERLRKELGEERSKIHESSRIEDEAVSLSYWLADVLGEHVDDQDKETLVGTVQRLAERLTRERDRARAEVDRLTAEDKRKDKAAAEGVEILLRKNGDLTNTIARLVTTSNIINNGGRITYTEKDGKPVRESDTTTWKADE